MTFGQELIAAARQAYHRAYAPYSNFSVGAALRARSGQIFTGCNVENASYGLTVCAEMTAVVKAVSEGERDFEAIAIVSRGRVAPCGSCRQVLAEFNPNLLIVLADLQGDGRTFRLSELLPAAFSSNDL